jgi:hypothetical protein
MILSSKEQEWILKVHPALVAALGQVLGTVDFTATYNEGTGLFQILYDDTPDVVAGLRLSGRFGIRLEERTDKSISRLPALYVQGVEASSNRHFGQVDHSACLCSPFDEDDFLVGGLDFVRFVEQLVIPFLYGQVFYSTEHRWPWAELSHGAVGLLESYFNADDPTRAVECLEKLVRDANAWPRIKRLIEQKSKIKGHVACVCAKADHIRRCHPNALKGIRRLTRDLRSLRGQSI